MADEFITIQSFTTEIEAEITRGRLLSEGIQSFIIKDDCGGMYPQLHLTQGVLLKVHASDFDRAAEAIEPVALSTRPAGRSSEPGEIETMLSINSWIIGIIGIVLILGGGVAGKGLYIGIALITVAAVLKFLSRRDRGR